MAILQSSPLVLLGGAVIDVQAEPGPPHELRTGGSVPGQVRQVAGGVARNIAEGAARLLSGTHAAADVLLVSVVGDDAAGDALLASCSKRGLSTSGIARCSGATTPCVCTVLDRQGEVAASVADVEAVEKLLTPALVRRFGQQIAGASLVVLDGNLSQDAIQEAAELASQAGVAVLYEPVSVAKAVRCAHVLHQLRYISPNAAELVAIARAVQLQQQPLHMQRPLPAAPLGLEACSPLQQLQQLLPFAEAVLATGVHCVIVTLGASGAARLTRQGSTLHALHVPALPATIVNLSGAGDALVAGFAAGLVTGAQEDQALALGVACAKAAVESRGNVAAGMQLREAQLVAQGVLAMATQWTLPLSSRL